MCVLAVRGGLLSLPTTPHYDHVCWLQVFVFDPNGEGYLLQSGLQKSVSWWLGPARDILYISKLHHISHWINGDQARSQSIFCLVTSISNFKYSAAHSFEASGSWKPQGSDLWLDIPAPPCHTVPFHSFVWSGDIQYTKNLKPHNVCGYLSAPDLPMWINTLGLYPER